MSIPADDKFFQYQVDFEPNEERSFNRTMLVREFHEQLPKYLYHGPIMFTKQQLNNDKSPVVFTTRRKSDNGLVRITMREMGEVLPADLCIMTGISDEKRARFLLGKAMDNHHHQLDNMTGLFDEMSITANDKFFQYRVGFEPDEERSFIRKMLVRNFQDQLPKYVFDGTILITRQQLNNDMSPVVFTTRRKKDNALIQITMREILPTDSHYKQINNWTDLLSDEFKFRNPSLLEEMRFQLGRAMAECSRQTPDKTLEPLTGFSQRSNDTNETKQLLSDWKLKSAEEKEKLLSDLKLKFAKEREKFNANNPEVASNWGNIIQKFGMTPSGFCVKWAVIYPPRDEGETKQFVTNLVRVSPSLGLVLGCPKTFKLLDDRPATYIQQLHKTMDMGPDLVMIAMADNKSEHYQAIDTKCSMEKWHMEKLVSSGKWAVIYPISFEGSTKEEFGKDETGEKVKHFGNDENGEKLKEFGKDEYGEKLKEFGTDENGEKLKQLEDEKDVVGCFSKFKAFMKQQWKKMVGCFGCLRPNTDLDKIRFKLSKDREKGDKESLLPGCTFISVDGELMKVGHPKLSK